MNNPSSKAITTINEINNIVNKLNELFNTSCEYNIRAEENQKLRSETLPIYEEQEIIYANIIVRLEHEKDQLNTKLKQLNPLHLNERKRLQHELTEKDNQIGLNYNNYSRVKNCVSEIIKKISANEEFLDAHPLIPTHLAHQHIIVRELNPAIKKISKIIKTPLVLYNPTSMFYIERFELSSEERFELEQ